jgi:transketolase
MLVDKTLEEKAINTIRFLSVDGVQKANSGHPGLPMGDAAIAYTIWTKHLKHNPTNPNWFNRDRFVLSGGHGSMLLYSLLHLTGYQVSLEDIKNFRQVGSITPGHPEYGLTPGVEVTTGPLGQGFGNGVGMAIAEAHLSAEFNELGLNLVDHYTYAIVTDGDLMEGVSSEAASLAGHLKLGKLIYFYDNNHITIDGSTDLAFTEDRVKRFEAYNWQVLQVKDGNNVDEIEAAIQKAKADDRPSLIICHTHIGFGLPTLQDTSEAHGKPPGDKELNAAKEHMGWPIEPRFFIPSVVLDFFRQAIETGRSNEIAWQNTLREYSLKYPDKASEFIRRINSILPDNWDLDLPVFPADTKGVASRAASGKLIYELSRRLPELMGGSADLTPSNDTTMADTSDFQFHNRIGRYIHFGVREHAMGAILNGMSVHKGLIPFGASFLVFTDYVRPAIRLSALSKYPVKWIFTHDSIGLGEDGPTHQPVEHLASLRAIPGLIDLRPADANEVREAWKMAIKTNDHPILMALSRQNLPTMDRTIFSSAVGLQKGAYILKDFGKETPQIILMASGSEVAIIVEAAEKLAMEGLSIRVISFPSWFLFEKQEKSYKEQVLPTLITKRVAVEAAVSFGWERWVGDKGKIIAIDRFGESGKYQEVYEQLGITVEHVYQVAKDLDMED